MGKAGFPTPPSGDTIPLVASGEGKVQYRVGEFAYFQCSDMVR